MRNLLLILAVLISGYANAADTSKFPVGVCIQTYPWAFMVASKMNDQDYIVSQHGPYILNTTGVIRMSSHAPHKGERINTLAKYMGMTVTKGNDGFEHGIDVWVECVNGK